MSSNRTSIFFPKFKEADKREGTYDDVIQKLLNENGLYRKRLFKGSNSLMRAISDALFFTPNQHEDVQQSLLKCLTQLVASNELTARLGGFQGNSMMLNDFANNPHLAGFEKTILELVSILYKVRVVLYTMNEDHYLNAAIYNNSYTKSLEILRTKTNQYDALFSKSQIENASICQNLIFNLIDNIDNKSPSKEIKNLNNNEFINIAYESSKVEAASPNTDNNDQFRITRGVHKKSLSDNFNTNFDTMLQQENKFFDAFMSAGFSNDDIFKNVKLRKDTAESGFSINANFDFIDEQNFDGDYHPSEFAIKNYPMPKGGISPRAMTGQGLDSPMPAFTKTKFSSHPHVMFNENLSLAEMDRIERALNTATTQDSNNKLGGASPFYSALSPPGLSPAKFAHTPSDFLGISPLGREVMSPSYPYSPAKPVVSPFGQGYLGMSTDQSFSQASQFVSPSPTLNTLSKPFSLQHQQYNNMYMKRVNPGASSAMGQDEFGQIQEFTQEGENVNEQQSGPKEKKKPIILDESEERFNGRLKFFDENKKYGFIVMDEDGSDIFVHYDDLCKANVTKEMLRSVRTGNVLRFNFGLMDYIGKYNRSRKAIDIQLAAN